MPDIFKKPKIKPPSPEQIQELLSSLPNGGQITVPDIHVPSVGSFFAPLSISSPAFNFSGSGGNFSLDRIGDDPRDIFDERIGGFFGQIDNLRGRFRPGFSELREARNDAVTAARQRGMSNLSERLANRRIQGSSFARAEQLQGQAEFGKIAAEQQAQSFLEEVAINTQLLQVENQGFNTVLQRAQSDLQEYALALQSAGLSAQVGTAHALAEVGASTAEAQLSVQAQAAQIQAALGIMGQLTQINAANAQLQQDWLGGIGSLVGTIGGGIVGFSVGGPAGAVAGAQIGGSALGGGGGGSSIPWWWFGNSQAGITTSGGGGGSSIPITPGGLPGGLAGRRPGDFFI